MVDRARLSRIGAGCEIKKGILVLTLLLFTGGRADAGFNWVSDWKVTVSNLNVPSTLSAPPPPVLDQDFITITGSSNFVSNDPQQTYTTASYAERQFELSGFSEPVRVTIQTVMEGWVTFNQWGLRAGLSSNNGVENNIQTMQRFQLLPGSNRIRITQTRDVWLTNGVHTISASLDPLITPSYLIGSVANAYVEGTLQIGVLVPEPSSWIAASSGLMGLMLMKYRNRKLAALS